MAAREALWRGAGQCANASTLWGEFGRDPRRADLARWGGVQVTDLPSSGHIAASAALNGPGTGIRGRPCCCLASCANQGVQVATQSTLV